ncbi:MAG: rubrerythrin [Phycisphaerales bacterium]|nr:MAG: rubrerythrin [Phycisphaerales bacterium]
MTDQNNKIIDLLIKSYNSEIETVMNYLANSVNLEGVRAEHIKESLAADITEELGHAQKLAKRIHTLGGIVPASQSLTWKQKDLQERVDTTDVVSIIRGVIKAEEDAIASYNEIIRETDGKDYVTQDLAIELLSDEEEHRREFLGFLKEYDQKAGS